MAAIIEKQATVDANGRLTLELPAEFRATNVSVYITTESKLSKDWPDNFFEATYGSCADDPLVRLPQGAADERDAVV